jgi:hypothetical protein
MLTWREKVIRRTLTFKEYLSKKLVPYKIALPVSLSVVTAFFAAYALLVFYGSSRFIVGSPVSRLN